MKPMTHRDQIHGDVRFDPLAVELLNTQALQRLGRIYQLGYSHLVYRGGTHTRLSHVMGAFHVAGKLVDLLRQNYLDAKDLPVGAVSSDEFLPRGRSQVPESVRWDVLRHLVRWAALLHDLGHIPLGHTLEDEFEGLYTKHDHFDSPRMPYLWHEISAGNESEIRKVFGRKDLLPQSFRDLGITGEQVWQSVMLMCLHKEEKREAERVSFKELIENGDEKQTPFLQILKPALKRTEGKTFSPYMADIVGNTICADYLDYLRRDPTNVGLDVLRDDRVASRFFIGKDSKGSLRMALALVDSHGKPRLDTCTGVVELVRQRYRFAEIIYYHKTKVAASAMLAKVFELTGKPPEIGVGPATIEIDKVEELAERVLNGSETVEKLRQKYSPSALLDPEIGDETLLLWLRNRAWTALEEARQSNDLLRANRCLRGVSLLQSLTGRRLYKVCFTVDQRTYAQLTPGSKETSEIERRIRGTLEQFREDESKRANLEAEMARAAGLPSRAWPDATLLLYVPPRKSQAKGIETGALDRGDVVTLGEHSAVRKEVSRLNEAYKGLWRMILFVHPNYAGNALGLSAAVDALIKGVWPSVKVASIIEAIRDAAWFRYIPEKLRHAALQYQNSIAPEKPNWSHFEVAGDTAEATVAPDEHASRAMLLDKVIAGGGHVELVKTAFPQSDSLSRHLSELESSKLFAEGREGMTPNEKKKNSYRHDCS